MCEQGESVVLRIPRGIDPSRTNRTVSIDRCIAGVIRILWEFDVQTLGCCCGHGKENPSVVIASEIDDKGMARIADLLMNDRRDWRILQWQLVEVKTTRIHGD